MLPLALFAGLAALAACNPVESWRNLTGANKNDPDPKTTPNTGNLAAGAQAPYPNLATVPPPPIGGLTEAQLEKLTQSLIADRANTKYNDEPLRGGFAAAAPPAPAAAAGAPPAATAAAGPTGAPPEQVAAMPPERASASASPAPAPAARAGRLPTGRRKPGEPPEPGPMESSLTMPSMAAMPPPESVTPAPPPPHLGAPQTSPAPAGTLASLPPVPEEAAPPPEIAPPKPPAAAAAKPAKPPPKGGSMRLAAVVFPSQSTTLRPFDEEQLAAIVPFYKTHPGIIRVIGYAGAAAGGSALAQLNSFSAALDRAQAVAAVLAKAGIPAGKIKVEAAPANAAPGPPRAEVLLEPAG